MKKSIALRKIMYAKSVAVVGASNRVGSVGNEIMKRLTTCGFGGKIYPINLHEDYVEGVKAYRNVGEVNKNIDFAILAVPNSQILSVVDECYKAEISCVVVVTAGFKELGAEGAKLQDELVKKIHDNKMCMIGPNCVGIINVVSKINASFSPVNPSHSGNIGFVSQSGALASGLINLLQNRNIGFSQLVSVGNQADIDYLDVIEFWEDDDNIKFIMAYVEGIKDAKRFNEICSRVSQKKPIIMLKSGRSAKGVAAASSHTGALAGEDKVIASIMERAGVIREVYLRDFVHTAQVFDRCNLPAGNKVAILTNAGGPGIIAADAAEDIGLPLANLSEETIAKLKVGTPDLASFKNPVDIIASASLEQFSHSANVLLESPEVDILVVIYLYITTRNDFELLDTLTDLQKKYPNKPIVAIFQTDDAFYEELNKRTDAIPVFHYGVDALKAVKRLVERKEMLTKKNIVAKTLPVDKAKVKSIVMNSLNYWKSKRLTTFQSMKVFEAYGIPVIPHGLARNLAQAKKIAAQIGYPVVLKISSRDVVHKSDIGGVEVNIKDVKELKTAWERMMTNFEKHGVIEGMEGIVVMKYVMDAERQFVVGATYKEGIGNMLMFGLGGIFVETFNQVAFTPCPLNLAGLETLLNSSKAVNNLLKSTRGYQAAEKQRIAEVLIRLSQLIQDFDKIAEIDVNPLIADKNGKIFAIDARINLK